MHKRKMRPRQERHWRRARDGKVVVVLAAVMAAVFIAGVWLMFEWRFRAGDIYPQGSSLRADPVGARALYDALRELPGLEVSRNYTPLRRLGDGAGKTVFILGAAAGALEEWQPIPAVEEIEEFVSSGARLVIAVNPGRVGVFRIEEKGEGEKGEGEKDEGEDEDEKKAEKKVEAEDNDAKEDEGATESKREEVRKFFEKKREEAEKRRREKLEKDFVTLEDRWELSLARVEKGGSSRERELTKAPEFVDLLQEDLPSWYSSLYLREPGPDWEVLARVDDEGVLARRKFGAGTVIIATDSYFASNQALARDRSTKFLAWLTGDNRNIVFDETHHGTVHRTNLMNLVRRFRLHGVFLGLGLFVGLLAWRRGSSLLPGDDELGMGITLRHRVSGQAAASGLRRILQRSVPRRDLLSTSYQLWAQQRSRLPRAYNEEQVQAVRDVLSEEREKTTGKMDTVNAYRRIVAILKKRT